MDRNKFQTQHGSVLILLLLGVEIIAIIFGLYVVGGSNGQKSQLETGQQAVNQAKQIQTDSQKQSRAIQEQLESN